MLALRGNQNRLLSLRASVPSLELQRTTALKLFVFQGWAWLEMPYAQRLGPKRVNQHRQIEPFNDTDARTCFFFGFQSVYAHRFNSFPELKVADPITTAPFRGNALIRSRCERAEFMQA